MKNMSRKISMLCVFLGLLIVAGVLSYRNVRLEKEKIDLEAKLEIKPDADAELQEKLDAFYEKEYQQKGMQEEIQTLAKQFLVTLYQSPATSYGQLPYVQEYLTDQGIRSLLLKMDPVTYAEVSEDIIHAIRSDEQLKSPENSRSAASMQLITNDMYVRLAEDQLRAQILVFADCSFTENSDVATASILLQAECVYTETGGWKIDSLTDFRQL